MSKYKNRFKIGDKVVSNHDYSYIPRGTVTQVCGVSYTGSIKLYGISGTYNPDNFSLLKETKAPMKDFKELSVPLMPGMTGITRGGLKVVLEHASEGIVKYRLPDGRIPHVWADCGRGTRDYVDINDIVDIFDPESCPIRETTIVKIELIPGNYGRVRITEGGYVHVNSMKSRGEILDAIGILEQILGAFPDE